MPETTTPPGGDGLLELAYVYALGAVSDSERREIAERLAAADADTSAQFTRIVREVRETTARMSVLDAATPPSDLRARILAAVDEDGVGVDGGGAASGGVVTDLDVRRAARRRRWTRVIAAAAAVVVIGVGGAVAVNQLSDNQPAQPSVAQVMSEPNSLTASAEVAGGSVSITASRQLDAAVVSLESVPPPPAGQVYQMWLMPADGTAESARSAGTMSADTMPPPSGEVITGLGDAQTVAITVEPGTGSPSPTTEPIVQLSLA
ncbi:anti-sigma factor [Rhodococcus tukisamuensis]|uniref:Regulator of SigK n=1 Tax=Rhodococcus tukisamuensis TaxID=168276 RepID=A0A1G6SL79_9NOCA|nr:anti-sigma factor [Rhodococcus tukisamuensis]SDD16866.1 Anti-sigma-K factor RskA [Rhodococcus tukisamuensis]